MVLIKIPHKYRPRDQARYLRLQRSFGIEEYVYSQFAHQNTSRCITSWDYLPVYWTHIEGNLRTRSKIRRKWFGTTSRTFKALNDFVEQTLDVVNNPVFTVVQHDEGLLLHKHLKIGEKLFTFSAGGCGDIPIPLLCDARPPPLCEQQHLASFKGVIDHPVHSYPYRQALLEIAEEDGIEIIDTFTSSNKSASVDYIELMAGSSFSLCPRGYGRTSFRLYESFQQGVIPVYIHDGAPWLPYTEEIDWAEIAIFVHYEKIHELPDFLRSIPENVKRRMRNAAQCLFRRYFTFAGMHAYIERKMESLDGLDIATARAQVAILRDYCPRDLFVYSVND